MNITVLYTLPTKRALASPFADTETDTVESAMEVARALKVKGITVTLLGIDEDHIKNISGIGADCIFNLIDWTGLDLPLSAAAMTMLEKTGIPVTGTGRESYLETANKYTMKKALDRLRLPTARWQYFGIGTEKIRPDFRYPVIVKLALEHCSIGLTRDAIVDSPEALALRVRQRIQTFHEPVIAEEFISGREFQVTVLETPRDLSVLPPAEIVYDEDSPNTLLTYNSRWDDSTPEYKTSHVALAVLQTEFDKKIRSLAVKTFRNLNLHDYARLDIRARGSDIFILEANCNPGLSDDIEYSMTVSYRAAGMTFADVVWGITQSALRRFST